MKTKAVLLVVHTLFVACANPPTPVPDPVRVENEELGIAVAALPLVFSVVSTSGPTIELEAETDAGIGRAVIGAGAEERFGINLVEAVKERKAIFESAEGGKYYGNRELGSPIGTAFTARGEYGGAAGRVEETWVYAIHPLANRVLTVTYTYPPGESEARVGHLLELLGEIEGLAPDVPE